MAGGPSPGAGAGTPPRWYASQYNFHPHKPALRHRFMATALGATMWFWIFYRASKDGPVLLGLRHPWDGHHGHHDEHHGDAHGDKH